MTSDKSLIEVQFPVSKVSKESYKERKAVQSQTLTGLGKWWGRKPLIMVRGAILGLLMPVSDNPVKDRDIFLKLLSLDEEGLWLRKNKPINPKKVYSLLSPETRKKYFSTTDNKIKYKPEVSRDDKQELQKLAFKNMSYDDKLKFCKRPEHVDTRELDWDIINGHLGTNANNLQELIQELGQRRYGKIPTLGDCFCGGGNIPFEAARLGLNTYASDLNPISALLTWSSLNILGSDEEEIQKLKKYQQDIYNMAEKQFNEWGIEHNEYGWRADAYLYCVETTCPECGYKVPLAPSWVVGRRSKVIASLNKNEEKKNYDIQIINGVSNNEIREADEAGTIKNDALICPNCNLSTPITAIRGDRIENNGNVKYGLRQWEKKDFIPRPEDTYRERLYCIRYIEEYKDENGRVKIRKHYVAPSEEDLKREEKVIELLRERFDEWQKKGYIPDSKIEPGDKTMEPIRNRGWRYWHQLFNPRQLLTHGLLMKLADENAKSIKETAIGLLGVNKCIDWNSKLCRWGVGEARESIAQTFYNQALNTIYNFGTRSLRLLKGSWFFNLNIHRVIGDNQTVTIDARKTIKNCDLWITDPPYADAINYHELSEFFLAWDKKLLSDTFPEWYTDSKRALAVRGKGYTFNQNMIEIYNNLTNHMPENGTQVVMFTHQDVKVWAELAMIMWVSGLRVTAAWNIATETEASGIKDGNYVKGTVLLVLRKQTSEEIAFEDEIFPEIEQEVKNQIQSMQELDEKEEPNFSDADYLLAAYASSLKVLTSYKNIEGIDIERELSKDRNNGETSSVEKMIQSAVKIAYDQLIPSEFDKYTWKLLTPRERFYIKGLEFEKDGIYKLGAYQELARGFGAKDYDDMLASKKANNARLKTASEYKMSSMQDGEAKKSVVRNALAAIYRAQQEETPVTGKNWLRNELEDYWSKKNLLVNVLEYLSKLEYYDHMTYWHEDAKYARQIKELVRHDGI